MQQPDSRKIRRSITRFRRLALVSAAAIMVLNLCMVYRITSVLDHGSGTKINISGRQRLLSQKIRSAAFEIDNAVTASRWDKLPSLLADLRQSTERLESANLALFGEEARARFFDQSDTRAADLIDSIRLPLTGIVGSSLELQKLTQNIIRRAPYIDQATIERIRSARTEIARDQGLFLPKMDSIVNLFEESSRAEIASGIRHARLGMMLLLGVLGATVVFIIEPTILIIRSQLRDLDRATRHAKRADAVRWRLLTNMGHEFRTPMNAIMGFAELLGEGALSDTERSRLGNSIYESSLQLTRLIETMLDMSAIESGQLSTVEQPCDLQQLLTRINIEARFRAVSKSLNLTLVIEDDCPRRITTDPRRLEQILGKLVDNAVKFTQRGGVVITAGMREGHEPPLLAITVADTGIGIGEELLGAIFDPFAQGEDDLTRSFGGAGLGLTIARDLARALGGDITVRSTPGRGSVFTLTLRTTHARDPGAHEPDTPRDPDHASALRGRRLLIVDDAKDNRLLLQHIFRNTGADIEFAHDGKQAIAAINAAAQRKQPFELVLMDMQMPVIDGYTATATLREQGFTTPIIALTAHALEGDREHCISAGCNDYISKPVNRAKLLDACRALLQAHPHARAFSPRSTAA